MKYFTEIPESPDLTYSQFLSANFNYAGETTWFENAADISAGTFFSRSQSHFVVHELYTSPRTSEARVYVGRKKTSWSEMDSQWNMGMWQPYFELDALRPEEQGLTGVFLDVNRENYEVLGFWTPVFIPSMGSDIREDNGALVSDSRWYRQPSREVEFSEDRPNSIKYKLSLPEAAKLANNGGYALMGRVGNKDQGPWMVVSGGNKPVNQLILEREIFKDISNPKVDATVSPTLTYHNLYSTDVGYTNGGFRTIVSYLEDHPEAVLPRDEDWAIQKLLPIQAYSILLSWNTPQIFSRSLLLQLSYLRVTGGGIQDVTSTGADDTINIYDQRMKFTNATQVRVQGELMRLFQRPLVTKVSYLYDTDQRGSMVNTEFLYYPSSHWALLAGFDALGVQDPDYKPSSFLNQYRANDRVYGGMTYVF